MSSTSSTSNNTVSTSNSKSVNAPSSYNNNSSPSTGAHVRSIYTDGVNKSNDNAEEKYHDNRPLSLLAAFSSTEFLDRTML